MKFIFRKGNRFKIKLNKAFSEKCSGGRYRYRKAKNPYIFYSNFQPKKNLFFPQKVKNAAN
jgi:hypothetical protein